MVVLLGVGCSAEDLVGTPPQVSTTTEATITIPFPSAGAGITRLELSVINNGGLIIQEQPVSQSTPDGWVITLDHIPIEEPLNIIANGYDSANTRLYTGTTQTLFSRQSRSATIHLHPPVRPPAATAAADWLSYDGTHNQSLTSTNLWQGGYSASLAIDASRGLFFWPDNLNGQTKAQVIQLNSDNSLELGNVFSLSSQLFSDLRYHWRGSALLDNEHLILAGSGAGAGTPYFERPILKILDLGGLTLTTSTVANSEVVPTEQRAITHRNSHDIAAIGGGQLLSVFDRGANSIGISLLSWADRVLTLQHEVVITTPAPLRGHISITRIDNSHAMVGWVEQQTLQPSDPLTTSTAMALMVEISGDGLIMGTPTQLLQATEHNYLQNGITLRRINDATAIMVAGEASDVGTAADRAWAQAITTTGLTITPATPQQIGSDFQWVDQLALTVFDDRYLFLATEGVDASRDGESYLIHTTFEVVDGAIGPLNSIPFTDIDVKDTQALQLSGNRLVLLQASSLPLYNGYYLVQP